MQFYRDVLGLLAAKRAVPRRHARASLALVFLTQPARHGAPRTLCPGTTGFSPHSSLGVGGYIDVQFRRPVRGGDCPADRRPDCRASSSFHWWSRLCGALPAWRWSIVVVCFLVLRAGRRPGAGSAGRPAGQAHPTRLLPDVGSRQHAGTADGGSDDHRDRLRLLRPASVRVRRLGLLHRHFARASWAAIAAAPPRSR